MLNTPPSPEVLVGIAAAVAILIVYDLFYVWPIHRRISALTDRCANLERSLGAVLGDLAARVEASDHRDREDLGRLCERLGQLELATETQPYEQAIGYAEKGEESARLVSCLGLTEGEAALVTLLHGNAPRRPEIARAGERAG
jgi:hypothetical protein